MKGTDCSNTTIKVVWDANETPQRLSKVIAPVIKNEIVLIVEVEVVGHPSDAPEEEVGGGIEVPCMHTFYGPLKKTRLN